MGRRDAGQLFADHHADDLGDGRVVAFLDAVIAAAAAAFFQGRGQVGRDTRHAAGADRLDPGLLDRLVDVAGDLAARHMPGMGFRIVVAQAQGHRIGLAPQVRDFVVAQFARGQGQMRRLALDAGRLAGEADGQLAPARHRPHRGAGDPLEFLDRIGSVAHAKIIPRSPSPRFLGTDHEMVTLTPDSGSSVPKQRW